MKDYYKEIKAWDWTAIKRDALHNLHWDKYSGGADLEGTCYLGSVLYLYPSGKYYMPWTTNQTEDDVAKDSAYAEALEAVAAEHGMYITGSDGDGCDVLAALTLSVEDFDANVHNFCDSDNYAAWKNYVVSNYKE